MVADVMMPRLLFCVLACLVGNACGLHIVCLGGSVTAGKGVRQASVQYPNLLRAALPANDTLDQMGHGARNTMHAVNLFSSFVDERADVIIWEFSLNAGYWLAQSHTVPLRMKARCGHTALLQGSRMVIVGGHDGDKFLSDVWECELNGLYWRQVGFTSSDRKTQVQRQMSLSIQSDATSNGAAPPPAGTDGHTDLAFAPHSPSGRRTKLQDAAMAMRVEAATMLQAHARARTARIIISWKRAQADLEYDAATYCQAIWRAWLVRVRVRRRFAQVAAAASEAAALELAAEALELAAQVGRSAKPAAGATAATAAPRGTAPRRQAL